MLCEFTRSTVAGSFYNTQLHVKHTECYIGITPFFTDTKNAFQVLLAVSGVPHITIILVLIIVCCQASIQQIPAKAVIRASQVSRTIDESVIALVIESLQLKSDMATSFTW